MFEIPRELDVFIRRDRRGLYVYLVFGLLVLALGIVLFLVISVFGSGLERQICRPATLLISALGIVPLKEILARWDRISGLRALQARWNALTAAETPPPEEIEHLRRLILKLYENAVLR